MKELVKDGTIEFRKISSAESKNKRTFIIIIEISQNCLKRQSSELKTIGFQVEKATEDLRFTIED